MKKLLFLIFTTAILSSTILGQQPAPTPPKEEDQVIKISTNLIQLDVTVTDKNGKLVTDLTSDDFELYENGEKQTISNFSIISKSVGGATAGSAGNAVPGNAQAGTPPGPATLAREEVRRTIAVVVDDMSLSHTSVFYARIALKKFVDTQMQPGDLVAIIRTGGGVGALQQFTSDKRLLHAAIDKIRWNPFGGSVDALTSIGQTDSELSERFRNESDAVASGNPKKFTGILTRESVADTKTMDYKATKNMANAEKGVYALTSFGVIKYIISGMAKLPGRKTMMLFSDGFNLGGDVGKAKGTSTLDFLQDVTDLANRSSVVVYTFDTRGLQSMSITASDSTYEIIDGPGGRAGKEAARTKDFRESQDGLAYLAHQTGGKALLNSNDLNAGIDRALYEQTGYYLLGYVPDAETFDATKRKYNKFEIKVKRPGVKVSYRSGFFTSGPSDVPRPKLTTAERQMADTLMSPFAESDIAVNVNALYADDPQDGAYVRSFLHIDAEDLTFSETTDGWKTATFDVAAVLFGDGGVPVENKESKYTIKTRGATYDTMLKNGFVYVLIMPIKKPGLYQYRVALRDASSGKLGSAMQVVDVPNLSKQKLTVSSLMVEDIPMSIWQNIAAGKVGNKPGQIQVPSSVLYDTVLKQFEAGTVLRYGFEVYNAKGDRSAIPQIETQAKIYQSDKVVVQGNAIKFDASGQPDAKHVKISGNMMLNESLQAGDYVLQILVTDTVSKQVSTQVFPFEIVK
jgi:VWFA-related protein